MRDWTFGLRPVAVLAAVAIAASVAAQDLATVIEESDKNGDGRLQRDEAPISVLTDFSEIDQDGDGAIDSFEAWEFEFHKRRRGVPKPIVPAPEPEPTRKTAAPSKASRPKTLVEVVKGNDRDGDDRLGIDEIPESQHEGFRALDANQDGFLDLDEARAIDERRRKKPGRRAAPAGPPPEQRSLERLVHFMDTDGDGLLQKKEAPLRVQSIFEQIDRNGDGAIDTDEAAAADAAGLKPSRARPRSRR